MYHARPAAGYADLRTPGPRPVPGGLGHPRRRRRDRDSRPQRRPADPRGPPRRALAPRRFPQRV